MGNGIVDEETDGLTAAFDTITRYKVERLIQSPEVPKPLSGTWIDLGSGGGGVTHGIQPEYGIDMLIWVDKREPKQGEPAFDAQQNPENPNRFMKCGVEDLLEPAALQGENIEGIFILNPWSDRAFFENCFTLAKRVLPPGGLVIIVCDTLFDDSLSHDDPANDMEQIFRGIARDHGFVRGRGLQKFDAGIGLVFRKKENPNESI